MVGVAKNKIKCDLITISNVSVLCPVEVVLRFICDTHDRKGRTNTHLKSSNNKPAICICSTGKNTPRGQKLCWQEAGFHLSVSNLASLIYFPNRPNIVPFIKIATQHRHEQTPQFHIHSNKSHLIPIGTVFVRGRGGSTDVFKIINPQCS